LSLIAKLQLSDKIRTSQHGIHEIHREHGSTEMLNDRNYHSWKRSLKALLIAEDAFGIVTGTEAPPNAGATAQLGDVAAAADLPTR